MKKVKNFSRFYALLNKAVGADKEQLVSQFTGGRTTSLREMTSAEYNEMCNRLQGSERVDNSALRQARSATLSALSEIGIASKGNDYSEVNEFCLRRSGFKKVFYDFTVDELKALRKQIFAIRQKKVEKKVAYVPLVITVNQIYA